MARAAVPPYAVEGPARSTPASVARQETWFREQEPRGPECLTVDIQGLMDEVMEHVGQRGIDRCYLLPASGAVGTVQRPAAVRAFTEGGGCVTYRTTSSNAATVRPETGSIQSAASSTSGSNTKRRSRKRGCGTVSP